MNFTPSETRPTRIRLDASSLCQLKCVSCPTASGAIAPGVGSGFVKLCDFKKLLTENPGIREIELSNYGEIFLNPDLLEIIKVAAKMKVALRAENGVNLNSVREDVLDGLVRYRFRSMTCSMDGATNETYRQYRIKGNLDAVIENIRAINRFKRNYRSKHPLLKWQFVVFGHNEHEIEQARNLAGELDMEFHLKLSWDPKPSSVRSVELLRRELGAASREEYRERFGVDYMQGICHDLWDEPQINWDGRVLGCSRNFWGDFGGNAFRDGLRSSLNSERIRYARQMLVGEKAPRDDVPCATCGIYLDMRNGARWLDRSLRQRALRSLYRSLRLGFQRRRIERFRRSAIARRIIRFVR